MYCNPLQKRILKRFLGVYRYFYNRTISYAKHINKEKRKSYYYIDPKDKDTKVKVKTPKSYYDWYELKKILYKNKSKWLKEIGYDSHSCKQAIKEALIGIKTNIKKHRSFTMKMKSKKDLVKHVKNRETNIIEETQKYFRKLRDRW